MRILIVNENDLNGGAARAALRLNECLKENGVDSGMLVQNKFSKTGEVIGPENKVKKLINLLRPSLDLIPRNFYKNTKLIPFSSSVIPFGNIINQINEYSPDIVHLHWIAGGMMRIEDLAKIKSPIVWSLHDDWAFTGGCHIKLDCNNYKNTCGSCKAIGSNHNYDLSKYVYKRKNKTYKKINNLTIVGLSKWLAECAQNSSLLGGSNILCIPNPINTTLFKPLKKEVCKDILNLNKNKKLVLFGAMNVDDKVKGFNFLKDAFKNIDPKNYEIAIIGSSSDKSFTKYFKQKSNYLGYIRDDISLNLVLNAADVVVVPSTQENLSNMIMESMACGTPVAAFNVGGNSDLIDHKINGYLAKPFDSNDLSKGIETLAQNKEDFRINARKKVLTNYSYEIVSKKYINLYENILNSS